MKTYGRKAKVMAWLLDNEPVIAFLVVFIAVSSLFYALEFGA